MQVILYTFSKRENSTKRPSDAGTPYTGNLLDSCSILNPSIGFNFGGTGNGPGAYNYAYIPEWNRFYWIDAWTWNPGLWIASMTVDALATWRDDIGASTQYVVRSSARFNGDIVDALYPATGDNTTTQNEEYFWRIFNFTYVVGIIGKSAGLGATSGAVNYYAMTRQQFVDFSNFLMGDTSYLGGDFGDLTIDALKVQYNPFQYVVSVKLFPQAIGGTDVSEIPIGWWNITCNAKLITSSEVTALAIIPIDQHPQISRGAYVNSNAGTHRTLFHPAFGAVELDCDNLVNASQIVLEMTIDTITGAGYCDVYKRDLNNDNLLCSVNCSIGVDIQIAQIGTDNVSMATNAIGAIASVLTGDFVGAAQGIGNAALSAIPQMQTKGSTGSFLTIGMPVRIINVFRIFADEDNEDRGKPLCERVQISTVPGYAVVADADISIPATAEENRAVKSYMEGGFFYE